MITIMQTDLFLANNSILSFTVIQLLLIYAISKKYFFTVYCKYFLYNYLIQLLDKINSKISESCKNCGCKICDKKEILPFYLLK